MHIVVSENSSPFESYDLTWYVANIPDLTRATLARLVSKWNRWAEKKGSPFRFELSESGDPSVARHELPESASLYLFWLSEYLEGMARYGAEMFPEG